LHPEAGGRKAVAHQDGRSAVQHEPQEQWVVAEQRLDGTRWPILMVANEREAIDIAQVLRNRGSDAIAIAVVPDSNSLP
jgi:hypothetical protein